jgi:hypothetical protein
METGGWPNTETNVKRVKRLLVCLAEKYGKQGRNLVFVDTKPHYPNAHVGLPGLLKCKGTSTKDRPHRLTMIDGGF